MLPNLLVIGAGKCGTTSLHQYLAAHPEIEMSRPKELQFFTREDWRERAGWYAAKFGDAPVRGESSPAYTMYPRLPSVPERARELIPEARLIYVVGDPVTRAVAHYVEWCALGLEQRPVEAALADGDDANPYISTSRYAMQLERYLRHFDRGQALVIDQLELRDRRDPTLAEAFSFLGVDASFTTPAFAQEHNVAAQKRRYGRLGTWLVKRQILAVKGGPFRRGPLVRPLRTLLSRPIAAALPPELQTRLAELFAPEVARLEELTGRTFARWPSLQAASR